MDLGDLFHLHSGTLMRRLLFLSLIFVILGGSLAAQQPPELPQKGSGPGKPLSPQEAQKLFKLDDGLRIELVACEPQIESPVAMAFDPDGRLWVVEMRDYPNGPRKEGGEKPMGRIRILEDKDGDGFFETSTIWADNLLFANGLLLWKDGAIVTMAPKITHLARHAMGPARRTRKTSYTKVSPPRIRSCASAIPFSASTAGSIAPTACAAARPGDIPSPCREGPVDDAAENRPYEARLAGRRSERHGFPLRSGPCR